MRFKRHVELEHGLKQIDIAPLIDMVFLLLIFFMLTSSFVMQPGIAIHLPKAVTSEVVKYDNIDIAISAENVIYVNGKAMTAQELEGLLRQVAKRDVSVLIKADKRTSLGAAVQVWDMCRQLNVSHVNIATNQEQ
ncbi:MAG TPA: biopolymer transporter ExbD [Patescibacteria group bacterium]|nr:biopolymer transporter ExbD [Patescibacteria group bacterium]